MKQTKLLFWWLVCSAFCLLSLPSNSQFQNHYAYGTNNDHFSLVEDPGNPLHYQLAGTHYNGGGPDIHFMNIDPLGFPTLELNLATGLDDRGFHIDAIAGGYGIAGIGQNNPGQNELLFARVNPGGGIFGQVTVTTPGFTDTQGLHFIESQADPIPGYVVVGFASNGITDASGKVAIIVKLDGALNVQWMKIYDTPLVFANDMDMASHVVEVPGQGYFISGSANGSSFQECSAVMLGYGGGTQWATQYADNTGGGHASVGASAIYCPTTNEIYQVANHSIIHHFGVNVFDAATGVRNVPSSFEVFSNYGYANIQGFKILESVNPDHLIVAGYMREHYFPELDPEGNPTGGTTSGSVPFLLEFRKGTRDLIWDRLYEIPSPGYNAALDIFSAFSGGQQPRILHPEMAIAKSDGSGYVLDAYRSPTGAPFDLEAVETDPLGINICSSADLDFQIIDPVWYDEDNFSHTFLNPIAQPYGLVPVTLIASVAPCNVNPPPCDVVPNFTTQVQECTYTWTAQNLGSTPAGEWCHEWTLPDGSVSNAISVSYTFDDCGFYDLCLSMWCCDDPTTKIDICATLSIEDCCCNLEPDFTWVADQCDVEFFGSVVGGNSGCWDWDFGDGGTSNVQNPVHTFPGSGTYTVCLDVCCINPDGTVTIVTICKEVTVQCCEAPPVDSFDYFPNIGGTNCEQGFCLPPIYDPSLYCAFWDWGDGTSSFHPVDECPIHIYNCDGVYTVCVTVFCCDEDPSTGNTYCETIDVDCPCNLPPNIDFTWNYDIDECSIRADIFLPDVPCPDEICWSWDFGDGTGQIGGVSATHTYPASGVYTLCLTVYCCDDPSISYTICQQVDVICPCEVPNFDIEYLGVIDPDNCAASVCITTPLDPNLYCAVWDWGDGTPLESHPVNICPTHSYACDGVYVVCVTVYCCDDPAAVGITQCIDIVVDCPCQAPEGVDISASVSPNDCKLINFNATVISACPEDYCYSWDFGDGTGIVAGGPVVSHTYASEGSYVVCVTVYCCDDPAGVGITVCITILVDCPCEVPVFDTFDYFPNGSDDCQQGFCLPPIFDPAEHCALWDWGDGTSSFHPVDFCPIHTYDCDGTYTVCVTVFCCEDDPATGTQVCMDIIVDCPCELPTAVDITAVQSPNDCKLFDFTATVVSDCPEDYCYSWDFGDGTGVLTAIPSVSHTYASEGSYVVCLTVFCCDDPAGVGITVCITILVDCPCEAPTGVDFDHFPNEPGSDTCMQGFCLTQYYDPADYCADWDWGDGTSSTHPTVECPLHVYDCDGIYTVCVTVYCCADPSIASTFCMDIVVDCPCTLPTSVDIAYNVSPNDCKLVDFTATTISECPEDYCFNWDFGDGVQASGGANISHTYAADGTYTVCVTAICCDDPDVLGPTVCITITIDCPCEVPVFDTFDYYPNLNPDNCEQGFCLPPIFDPAEHCSIWNWGDGTPSESHPVNSCPTHTYACDGIYTVCVTVYCCNEDPSTGITVCLDLLVDCPCSLPTSIDLTYNVSPNDCKLVDFTATTISDCPEDYCFNWDFGDGVQASGGANISHTYAADGTYTVCVTAICCDDPDVLGPTVCVTVVIDCDCPQPCDVYPMFQHIVNGCTVEFYDFSYAGPYTTITGYSWDFGDGNTSSIANPVHTYGADGTYTVCLTVTATSPEGDCEMVFCWDVETDCGPPCPDFNGNGFVDFADLLYLLGYFGQPCP